MSPLGVDGKIGVEGEIYLNDSFWDKFDEMIKKAAQEREALGWKHENEYKLDNARIDEKISGFPEDGDCIVVLSLDGSAEIKLDSPTADAFDLEVVRRIRQPFEDLYLSNTAQAGKTLNLLIGKGDWELEETTPTVELSGLLQQANLAQITDPDKLADGIIRAAKIATHAVEAAKIAENAITETKIAADSIKTPHLKANIVTGDKIAAETITGDLIASNIIATRHLIAATITAAKISTGAVTADKIAANSITAGKLNITDLVDIANLLTVAGGRIQIGANVLGAGLHGILITDNQDPPVKRVKIGHVAAGIKNYAMDIWDEDGLQYMNNGRLMNTMNTIFSNSMNLITTNSNVYVDVAGMSGTLGFPIAGVLIVIAHIKLWRQDNGGIKVTFNIDGDDKDDASIEGGTGGGYFQSVTIIYHSAVASGNHTVKLRWKVAASTGEATYRNLLVMGFFR